MNSILIIGFLCSFWTFEFAYTSLTLDCPIDGSDIYYPNEDCAKFWQCANGQAVLKECPSGLHFNLNSNVCDWPANVNCDNNDNDEINNQDDSDDNDIADNDENNTKVVQCENVECPSGNTDLVAHKPGPNCTTFCKCSNGVPHLQSCPPGLYFNAELEVCDYPKNSGCVETSDTEYENESDIVDNESDSAENDGDGAVDQVLCNRSCSEDDDTPFPASSCSNYCICSNGVQHVLNCPSGLEFNEEQHICDWPEFAGCQNN